MAEQDRLNNHWSQVVKAGDYKHGLDFSFEQTQKAGDVKSLKNYLMRLEHQGRYAPTGTRTRV
jgi:hypothetical protein